MPSSKSPMALLILEGPWWTPEQKPKRPSVLSFFEGMENYRGDFNIYYSNFYEKTGFRRALEDDLLHTREDRLFLYVAAHGYPHMFGGMKSTRGMQIGTLMRAVKHAAHYTQIEGVVLGSCNIGSNVGDFVKTITSSHIAWMFGYTCEIDWMTSTMVDVSVFEQMMSLKRTDLRSMDAILTACARGLQRFNPGFLICREEGGERVRLADAFTFVVQPRGRGRKPQDVTLRLKKLLGWDQAPGEGIPDGAGGPMPLMHS
jgi:hypothetical protein